MTIDISQIPMRRYKIRVYDEELNLKSSQEVYGYDLGAFAVEGKKDSRGTHRVTHLHSGLCLREISFSDLERSIEAAMELISRVPKWNSSMPDRIAEMNGMTMDKLKDTVKHIQASFSTDDD